MKRKKTILAFLLLFLNAILLLLISNNFTPIYFFFSFFLFLSFFKNDDYSFLVHYGIGVLIMIFFYEYWLNFYENPYFLGKKSDDWNYDFFWTDGYIQTYGLDFSRLEEHLNSIERGLGIQHNSKGYLVVIIVLKWITSFLGEYHTFVPRLLNIFTLTLVSIYSGKIAFFYTNDKKIKKVTEIVVFFLPVMLFNSVHVFRDTLVSFFIVYMYYTVIRYKISIFTFIKIALCLYCLYYFRTSSFFVSVLVVILLYINPKKIGVKVFIPFLFFFVITIYYLQNLSEVLLRQIENYNTLNTERFGNIGGKIFSLPIYIGIIPRFIYLIFTPVPNFSGFHQIYTSITAFIQVLMFPFLFLGLKSKELNLSLKLVFLLFFSGIAMSTASFRHVMMYLPFGIIITTISFFKFKNRKNINTSYTILLIALLFMFVFSITLAFTF